MGSDFGFYVIDKSQYAVIATVNEDLTPYCIPVSAVRDINSIYFHCAQKGHKTDNLISRPNACMTFVGDVTPVPKEFTTEYESAVITGRAHEVITDEEKIHALRLICLKYAADGMDKFDSEISRSLFRTAVWKIDIETITAKRKKYDSSGKEMKYGRME